jgi:soluble lytic murein transglycosylase-like protein
MKMPANEIETVLSNWIEQALSPVGRLDAGTKPALWVASHFSDWWKQRAGYSLGDAARAASAIWNELMRLGGWESFGEVLHKHTHLQDALADFFEVALFCGVCGRGVPSFLRIWAKWW